MLFLCRWDCFTSSNESLRGNRSTVVIFNSLLLFQIASRRFLDVHTHNYFFSTYTQACCVSKLMQSLWYFQHTIHSTQVEAWLPSSLHIFILKDSFGDDFYPLPSCALLTKRYFLRHRCKFFLFNHFQMTSSPQCILVERSHSNNVYVHGLKEWGFSSGH